MLLDRPEPSRKPPRNALDPVARLSPLWGGCSSLIGWWAWAPRDPSPRSTNRYRNLFSKCRP